MEVRRLGRIGYSAALELQDELVGQRQRDEIPDTLLLLEHPSVLTLGRAASEGYILDPTGLEVVRTGRGGEVTYHGPGQLVVYAIVRATDLHRHLRWLEEAVLEVAAHYGIAARQQPGRTGVWVGQEKLASIGIKVARWVTSHGLALNVGPDLSGFERIVPCGLEGVKMTSLARLLGAEPPWDEVEEQLTRHLIARHEPARESPPRSAPRPDRPPDGRPDPGSGRGNVDPSRPR